MTPIDLTALSAADREATPGPWIAKEADYGPSTDGPCYFRALVLTADKRLIAGTDDYCKVVTMVEPGSPGRQDKWPGLANQRLIAAMRNALPSLIRELTAARAVVEAARGVARSFTLEDMAHIDEEQDVRLIEMRQAILDHDRAVGNGGEEA